MAAKGRCNSDGVSRAWIGNPDKTPHPSSGLGIHFAHMRDNLRCRMCGPLLDGRFPDVCQKAYNPEVRRISFGVTERVSVVSQQVLVVCCGNTCRSRMYNPRRV